MDRGACWTPLQSMGLQRVRHKWTNNTHTHRHTFCQQTITGLWLEPLWVLKSLWRSQTPFFPCSFIPPARTLFLLPQDPEHFMGSQKCQTFPWINRNLLAFVCFNACCWYERWQHASGTCLSIQARQIIFLLSVSRGGYHILVHVDTTANKSKIRSRCP